MTDQASKKLEKFIEEYDSTNYELLPKFMRRRVDALKKLQLEHIKIQHQYNKRLQELEMEFEKLHKPLYEKRAQIISGDYEPTDEECQLPAAIVQNEVDGDQENSNQEKPSPIVDETEEAALKSKFKGLPSFWLGCLSSTYNFSDSIEKHDRPVLKYLRDIQLSYEQKDNLLSYKLEFLFDENPYFEDKVLTKTYYLKSNPDEKNPFAYEGFEVFKSEGCPIHWKEGKDITVKLKKVKQQNKVNGTTREKIKSCEQDSFFYFFKPPQMPEGGEEELDDEVGAIMAVDFELGELIRQSLIPRAVLFYNGFMRDDEDEDEDDYDDDDSDDDDDGESDFDDSDDDSHASNDSLIKKDK